jgi:adenine/guanine phosphoribosyltransferase-like PRPP-binding protein
MKVIDPLKYKILELMTKGQIEPLNYARLRYGTESDIRKLIDIYSKIKTNIHRYIYIDLIPFERFGHISQLGNSLLNQISEETFPSPILIAKFNEEGNFLKIEGGSKEDEKIKELVRNDLTIKKEKNLSNIMNFRSVVSDKILTELLFRPGCLDIPNKNDESSTRVYISGRYYRVMSNNMLVSCYLNLKEIGNDYNAIYSLAYEIVLFILEYFRRDIDLYSRIDALVTTNNTALIFASCVQAILGKPVIAIDKLGPIPSLNLHSRKLRNILENKNIILIEEVVATGGEVDRALFFLNNMNTSTIKIIAIYNLEIGIPRLVSPDQIISLCKPKEELQYVYRSK